MNPLKDMNPLLFEGDCLELMQCLPDSCIDAVVTDPPYGLSFMNKGWDHAVPPVAVWQECFRLLKPGGHLLAFAGTRTQHRMCCNIEDAGFQIRDMIAWVYGSGFPKSHDISKAIDKAAGAEREVIGPSKYAARKPNGSAGVHSVGLNDSPGCDITAPAHPEAKQWQGWGTALKPAFEPVTVARKPLQGTVAENVLQHGTGGLNIDGSRIEHNEECKLLQPSASNIDNPSEKCRQAGRRNAVLELKPEGRWPANFIHDGSPEAVAPLQGNQRFFYCAKADQADRDAGLSKAISTGPERSNRDDIDNPYIGTRSPARNNHPTVKPLALMKYLCRLVTQPGGVVLDPFMGSGTTGRACLEEGFIFVGMEKDPEYFKLCQQRVTRVQLPLFGGLL